LFLFISVYKLLFTFLWRFGIWCGWGKLLCFHSNNSLFGRVVLVFHGLTSLGFEAFLHGCRFFSFLSLSSILIFEIVNMVSWSSGAHELKIWKHRTHFWITILSIIRKRPVSIRFLIYYLIHLIIRVFWNWHLWHFKVYFHPIWCLFSNVVGFNSMWRINLHAVSRGVPLHIFRALLMKHCLLSIMNSGIFWYNYQLLAILFSVIVVIYFWCLACNS